MSKHIRAFGSFQSKRRNIEKKSEETETINETVIQRDNTFIVGGVKVEKKTINSYAKKVKDQTGKDLKSMYSEMEIAEELVKWSVNSLDNIDNVPVSALMGGEEEMAQDMEMTDETELDETGELDADVDANDELDMSDDSGDELDMSDDSGEEDTVGDEDLDMSDDSGEEDEFETPSEDADEGEEDEGFEDEDENEDEEDELPI
ncbi:MAG: hypothetical protein SLAVMIC_00337 [uncultured marine phage]|uniref:Uncharacterized protein n=1 Tax=uncultured marine phage TaxID=707152 RepID=A0A8D9CCW0_9VIRU|nr:MAG: hypothetical protein SLAVMIC_00337 [uncultured marine phage]